MRNMDDRRQKPLAEAVKIKMDRKKGEIDGAAHSAKELNDQ